MQTDEEDVIVTDSNTPERHTRPLQTDESYESYATKTTASLETPPATPPAENSTNDDTRNVGECRKFHNIDHDDHTSAYSQSEPDEDSSFVFFSEGDLPAVAFEPPYIAPLAPLLTPKRWRRKHSIKAKQVSTCRPKTNIKRKCRSPVIASKENFKSYDSLCEMFLQNERYASASGDAGSNLKIEACDKDNLNGKGKSYYFGNDDNRGVGECVELDDKLLCRNDGRTHRNADKRKLQHTTSLTLDAETSQHRRNNLAKINCSIRRNTSSKFTTPLAPMTDDILENNFVNEEDCCPPTKYNETLFFTDGVRSIDFVLAYKVDLDASQESINAHKRFKYEANLLQNGLQMEVDIREQQHIHFVKIHAPLDVLRRYAEILKLRMPMKEDLCSTTVYSKYSRLLHAAQYLSRKIPGMSAVNRSTRSAFSSLKSVVQFFLRHIFIDERYFPRRAYRFTAIYSRDKEYLFDIHHRCFFTNAVRSRIVQFILDRQYFDNPDKDPRAFGIDRMVESNVYCAAYPLHDGEITEKGTMREALYTHWASVKKWYRYQPLDYVKEYFGVKIGLYFAWLGFYTYMLLLASLIGIICFVYSLITLKDYVPVQDVCSNEHTHNLTMCPLCDRCDFWYLKETCFYAKITYLFDNPSTVFFAVFMSFWATLFLELWKRYSAEITHRWDLTGFDVHEEHPRPEYLSRLGHVKNTRTRIDYVTNIQEPVVPFWRMKFPATILSVSVVFLLILLAFVALVAVVVYRMSMLGTFKLNSSTMTTSSAIMLATASAAFVNLCLLYMLNYVYTQLAEYLTELEMWRTQTQFDDSLTLKIYLLQFVNYYASIFYIAFFKGKFVGHPGKYNTIFDYRQEECSSGGCLTELCIQLAIIMIGKQAFNTILEVIMPKIWRKIMAIQVGLSRLFNSKTHDVNKEKVERYLRDLKLLDWGPRSLFPEYLEMVLQYGFVTLFVAAFPLAPFFALLNNIFEMRLDAKKLLANHRRPVSQRVRDIGVWYRILDSIGKLSVITNGFIIAFTSDFIPRLVYRASSEGHTLAGYLNFTLSEYNITESDNLRSLAGDDSNIRTCFYADFREPPTSPRKYYLTSTFYIILACRLAFVVVFENFVALVMILVRWCIPDMSVELRDQIRREVYLTNEIIIAKEAERARLGLDRRSCSVCGHDYRADTM
ncbi:anoctamin-1 isoform X1 [Bactrocera neohumeralis]|uniref:anoctamin-1 isoform X1 n=1 Tax=Bactrocera neohumeralis TaxID=98809 RepID=UPI0021660CFE|nr:anoctamin-1 isoform X1 [Bactrocera neohumeralis]